MERINKILHNTSFLQHLQEIACLEKERIFCKHDIDHFLSVARIMYISSLENNLKVDKALIYTTAILHDIGRHIQYKSDIPHEIASIPLAKEILEDVGGFSQEEQEKILNAIIQHNSTGAQDPLAYLLQYADRESRNCFACNAKAQCKWTEQEKNRKDLLW